MIFSSLIFLFWFIPIFFTIYYIVPFRFKNAVLLIGSMIFYAWGEPKYMLLLILSVVVNYLAGRLIEKGRGRYDKAVLIAAVVFDLSMLFFFKYINFFIDNINSITQMDISNIRLVLPLGISFYTFQIMSYVIDLYRGKVSCEKSIIRLGAYLCMFPQLIAGPIVVYSEVSRELSDRKISLADIEEGLKLFVIGLSAKVLVANNAGKLWDELITIGYDNISAPLAWLGMLAYTIQIYFDFNGYSMMAIGLGKMLGFRFPKNFDLPYTSCSITEYWRRWHMTLSGWFREYLYIPLGGNRRGSIRTYVNLFIVWFATGFWHGADWNFILWGLYFYALLMLEKLGLIKYLEANRIVARIYTLLAIEFGWMLFAISDLTLLGKYLSVLFTGGLGSDILYYGRNYLVILLIGMLFSTPYPGRVYEKHRSHPAVLILLTLMFAVCVAYLADASFNPFLYFRF